MSSPPPEQPGAQTRLMGSITPLLDRLAIGLSVLCTLHCLALPLLLTLGPAAALLPFLGEGFHRWLVLLALPTSIVALFVGCREHRHWSIAVLGAVGLALLVGAVLLGHDLLGETGERVMTVTGAVLLATSHFQNFMRCRSSHGPTEACPG